MSAGDPPGESGEVELQSDEVENIQRVPQDDTCRGELEESETSSEIRVVKGNEIDIDPEFSTARRRGSIHHTVMFVDHHSKQLQDSEVILCTDDLKGFIRLGARYPNGIKEIRKVKDQTTRLPNVYLASFCQMIYVIPGVPSREYLQIGRVLQGLLSAYTGNTFNRDLLPFGIQGAFKVSDKEGHIVGPESQTEEHGRLVVLKDEDEGLRRRGLVKLTIYQPSARRNHAWVCFIKEDDESLEGLFFSALVRSLLLDGVNNADDAKVFRKVVCYAFELFDDTMDILNDIPRTSDEAMDLRKTVARQHFLIMESEIIPESSHDEVIPWVKCQDKADETTEELLAETSKETSMEKTTECHGIPLAEPQRLPLADPHDVPVTSHQSKQATPNSPGTSSQPQTMDPNEPISLKTERNRRKRQKAKELKKRRKIEKDQAASGPSTIASRGENGDTTPAQPIVDAVVTLISGGSKSDDAVSAHLSELKLSKTPRPSLDEPTGEPEPTEKGKDKARGAPTPVAVLPMEADPKTQENSLKDNDKMTIEETPDLNLLRSPEPPGTVKGKSQEISAPPTSFPSGTGSDNTANDLKSDENMATEETPETTLVISDAHKDPNWARQEVISPANPAKPEITPQITKDQIAASSGEPKKALFKFDVLSKFMKCHMHGCEKITNCWDGSTVCCPACGPYSSVRYCSPQHLYEDLHTHCEHEVTVDGPSIKSTFCKKRALPKDLVDEDTITPHTLDYRTFPDVRGMPPFKYDSIERHRQAVYYSMNKAGDYFIFFDADNFPGGVLGICDWADTQRWRGQGKVGVIIDVPGDINKVGTEKWNFNTLLSLCLSNPTLPANHFFVWDLFRKIRAKLEERGLWTYEIVTYLSFQFQYEFNFNLTNDLKYPYTH